MPKAGRVGDNAACPADSHGAPCCAHGVSGPAVAGSPDVSINNKSAVRVGDPGVHSACCGPNTWHATSGSSTVMINGVPAHRLGDSTAHCGGGGTLVQGSDNVLIGDRDGFTEQPVYDEGFIIVDADGDPVPDRQYTLTLADGRKIRGRTDEKGRTMVVFSLQPEDVKIEVLDAEETLEEDW
ncbi:PAAR domain-containing protein [Pseudenhygromyxa sp. WMMC2535]|uniref:PAAR domain-containing protein n=1 Tax=Pseudenhygromyxa sp. WMMC2535 TaxID=2712867 RepID=UPI001552EAC7|nr:PAAR domain-containing protein [Pseudenhygromyxa sp. WMMC2535]NVB39679.1 PAAR domain-containing protein [Pseudenhygromyxa sp. WMMC2535]